MNFFVMGLLVPGTSRRPLLLIRHNDALTYIFASPWGPDQTTSPGINQTEQGQPLLHYLCTPDILAAANVLSTSRPSFLAFGIGVEALAGRFPHCSEYIT